MKICHNCRIKTYPDGSSEWVICDAPFGGGEVRREPARYDQDQEPETALGVPELVRRARQVQREEWGYAVLERSAIEDGEEVEPIGAQARAASLARARRRARVAVRDLGLCNDWAFFVTLTLDRQRINRYDPAAVVRKLNSFLSNHVQRHGLQYVLVPEHHRDGAIHFHGFFNEALPVVDSGHRDRQGHPVYNLPAWGWGFSTAIRLYGERAAAVAYCCKYVAKQQEKIGGRWYYSGGDLRRPEISWADVDFQEACQLPEAEPFQVDGLPWSRFLRLKLEAQEP